ncbi:MAG: hypothetical protein LBC63_00720 [Holophagales bacterium]|jgi:hypothetical protein|nr:hypothetical protein [Holophagales bacterium]
MSCKSLAEALATIERMLGKDTLQNGSLVIACLTDLLPDQKAVRKVLEAAIAAGVTKAFTDVCGKAPDKQASAVSQYTVRLYDDCGFKKTLVEDVLWAYGRALGFEARLGQHPSQSPQPPSDILSQVKMRLRPMTIGDKNELLITRSHIALNIYTNNGETITYQYDSGGISELNDDCLNAMKECLDDEGWHDKESYGGSSAPTHLFELEAKYEDGRVVNHRGVFDRLHVPEVAFRLFIGTLYTAVNKRGLGGIIALDGFMMAIRPDEVKYCGVEFSDGGKIYHYQTDDLSICVGDKVLVPAGRQNEHKEVTVRTVDFCNLNSPLLYPLNLTKKIIRRIT